MVSCNCGCGATFEPSNRGGQARRYASMQCRWRGEAQRRAAARKAASADACEARRTNPADELAENRAFSVCDLAAMARTDDIALSALAMRIRRLECSP